MVSFSTICAMALATTYSVAQAEPVIQKLPWDGRFYNLTVANITTKYLDHIFTMRNQTNLKVADFVTIDQKGRPKAYNGDTGVCDIGVNGSAIFKGQMDFRRSELVQFVAANKTGKTFFRTSLMKMRHFRNKYMWQCILDEHQFFQVRIDASLNPPVIMMVNGGTWESKWNMTFEYKTWYNFGFALSCGPSGKGHVIEMYTSQGDKDLKLTTTHTHTKDLPDDFEYHIGMLTLSDDKSEPKMKKKMDYMSFNGVTVTGDVLTSAK